MSEPGTDTPDALVEYVLAAQREGRKPTRAEIEALIGDGDRRELVEGALRLGRVVELLRKGRPDALTLETGTRLGDFEVEGELARGGMGIVYRAKQLSLGGREVALKVVELEGRDERVLERFRREALALADLHHPNLAEVHGFGVEDEHAFLAMRLVPGPSLSSVLRDAPAADPESVRHRVRLLAQVASALAEVHARGLIHRDVKPSNVVLEGLEEGERVERARKAVLIDFGLVRSVDASASQLTHHHAGTAAYAAREQLLGEPLDARTDVFGLGVTLHDLLSGRRSNQRARAAAGLEPIERLVPVVDRDLAAVVAKACDPDGRWRYADAGALARDLEAWLGGRSVLARRASVVARTRRWLARHPHVVGGLGGAVLVLTLAVVAGAYAARGVSADRELARAFARADLLALDQAAAELPALSPAGLFGRGAAAEAALERLRSPRTGDRLPGIVEALRDRDLPTALMLAAASVRVQGYGADPLLERFLLAECAREADAARAGEEPIPLGFLSRLVFERPPPDAAEFAACEVFRERIRTELARDDLPEEHHLHLASALGGLGAARDLEWLTSETLRSDATAEDRRLGLHAIDALLCSSLRCGFVEELRLEELADQLTPLIQKLYAEVEQNPQGWSSGLECAVRNVSQALAVALRAQGREAPLDRWLGDGWEVELGSLDGWRAHRIPLLLAAAGDARVAECFRGDLHREPGPDFIAGAWGRAAGMFADPELEANARERVVELFDAEYYEREIASGRALLRGERPDSRPDPRTMLGAPAPDRAPEVLEFRSIPASTPEFLFNGRASDGRGGAHSVEVLGGRLVGENVILDRFGDSAIRLQFDLPNRDRGSLVEISIEHQHPARRRLPRMGRALIDLVVDGAPFGERRRVGSESRCEETLELGPELRRLPAESDGDTRHELTIRLNGASTAPYWIHRVHIQRR